MGPRLFRAAAACLLIGMAVTVMVAPAVVIIDPLLPLATMTCALWLGTYVTLLTLVMLVRSGAGHIGRAVRTLATATLTVLPALTIVAVGEHWFSVPPWVFAIPLALGVAAHMLLLHRALAAQDVTPSRRGMVARERVSQRDTVEV